MNSKNEWMDLIATNINQSGQHITIVKGVTYPRFAYTIGLSESLSMELVFAGGIEFMADDLIIVLNQFSEYLRKRQHDSLDDCWLNLSNLGQFRLTKMHASWTEEMALGVYDYYQTQQVECYQVIPDQSHFTLDVPNMGKMYEAKLNPIWKYLKHKWDLNVPEDSTVITDLQALKGKPVTELMRWEENEWEMFSGPGPEMPKEQIRIAPIATMLGMDQSLSKALELESGKGLWRSSKHDEWQDWG